MAETRLEAAKKRRTSYVLSSAGDLEQAFHLIYTDLEWALAVVEKALHCKGVRDKCPLCLNPFPRGLPLAYVGKHKEDCPLAYWEGSEEEEEPKP